jgi:hypothetical protein
VANPVRFDLCIRRDKGISKKNEIYLQFFLRSGTKGEEAARNLKEDSRNKDPRKRLECEGDDT